MATINCSAVDPAISFGLAIEGLTLADLDD